MKCYLLFFNLSEAKRRAFRNTLRDAMASQDVDQLRSAIQQMEALGFGAADAIILDQAKKMLQFLLLTRGKTVQVSSKYICLCVVSGSTANELPQMLFCCVPGLNSENNLIFIHVY